MIKKEDGVRSHIEALDFMKQTAHKGYLYFKINI